MREAFSERLRMLHEENTKLRAKNDELRSWWQALKTLAD